MPRVKEVKLRKPVKCDRCRKKLKPGDRAIKWKTRNGFARFSSTLHARCLGCRPKPSELVSSDFVRAMMEMEESIPSMVESVDDARALLEELQSSIEGLKSDEQDKYDNMPGSLQQSPTGQLIEERIAKLDELEGEIRNKLDDLPDGEETDFDIDGVFGDLDFSAP